MDPEGLGEKEMEKENMDGWILLYLGIILWHCYFLTSGSF